MYLFSTEQICPFFFFSFASTIITQEAQDYIFALSNSNTTENSQLPLVPAPLHSSPSPEGMPWSVWVSPSDLLTCTDTPFCMTA